MNYVGFPVERRIKKLLEKKQKEKLSLYELAQTIISYSSKNHDRNWSQSMINSNELQNSSTLSENFHTLVPLINTNS